MSGTLAESGSGLAAVLVTLAVESRRGRGRPTGWATPWHLPRRHSISTGVRLTRSRHACDRSRPPRRRPETVASASTPSGSGSSPGGTASSRIAHAAVNLLRRRPEPACMP